MSGNSQSGPSPGPDQRHGFIVDDELQVRSFVSKTLAGAGFIPHEFSRVAEVEAALTLVRPDVIILDLSLGGSDAVEIMRSLAASLYSGHILLVSGHSEATLNEVRRIGERSGLAMLPILRKPFRIEELKARLAGVTTPAGVPADGATLEAALRNNWLELWYQPKVNLKSMAICGAEALIRLRHPERGVVQPAAFLPPPGDPLYQPLTDFIVRRSLADWSSFAAWPSIGQEWTSKRLAVNVPVSVLQSTDFVTNMRRHLPEHRQFPGLIVEITEDEATADPELAREIAIQLQLYNVHVSIDDFGIGHSSLARLEELPFAELKLDRSFVDGCSTDDSKRSTCRAVADMARRFGLATVAEGVETADDLKVLIDMGYDVAQGFYFAKPMYSGEFAKLLTSSEFEIPK